MYIIKKNQKSIYQANNIEESVMNVGLPPKPWLILHELILWIPLFRIMKFVHAWENGRK